MIKHGGEDDGDGTGLLVLLSRSFKLALGITISGNV